MQELIQHTMHNLMRYSALAWIVLATTFALAVDAQAQTKRGNTAGAPTGAVGGGLTGASNRGGAGGVSNPSPGGGSATAGEPGSNNGPQGTETSRQGYLGGRSTDTVNPPPGTTTINSVTVAQFGQCPTPGGTLSAQARMSGDNVGRIETVSRYLTRGPKREGAVDARYLLADLQEELQKAKPDLTLAGTYLGIVAKTAITPSLAADIGNSLCSPMSVSAAEQVANIAEAQRRKLAQER